MRRASSTNRSKRSSVPPSGRRSSATAWKIASATTSAPSGRATAAKNDFDGSARWLTAKTATMTADRRSRARRIWRLPRSRPQDGAARTGEEACLEQQRHDLRLADRTAVEALDREPLRAAALHMLDESGERRAQPRLVRLAQRHERAAAALDEQCRFTAEQHHVRACNARGARAGALRPRQCRAVRLRRIRGGQHERLRLVSLARTQLAQALDRAGRRKLRAAEALDEVAATADAQRLEIAQLAVHGAVAAGDSLAADAVARDDALPLEQELSESAPVRPVREQPCRRRPAALRRRDVGGALPGEAARPHSLLLLRGMAPSRAQRRPRIVGHVARPDELPQCGQGGLGLEIRCSEQVEPEKRLAIERCADRVDRIAFARGYARRCAERGCVFAEEDRDAVETGADPDDLAGCAELIELRGLIPGNTARQHLRLPQRHRQREPLQRHERLAQRRATVDPVPRRQEPAERALLGRLDLAAKRGERRATQTAEDIGVAPFALAAARPQLSAHELLLVLEREQLRLDVAAEMVVRLPRRERTATARKAQNERAQRRVVRLQEDVGEPTGRHHAERVAVSPRVLCGDQPLLRPDARAECAPLRLEHRGVRLVELARPQIAAETQQVVELVGVPRIGTERTLDLRNGVRVEQVAELLLAEQLAQQVAVERERLRPPLRRRRVVLVHVRRDVVEEQTRGVR